MKKHLFLFMAAALAAGTLPLYAQFGGGPAVPPMDNSLQKLFGDNQTFSADTHIQVTGNNGPMTLSGKMYFDNGNSRTEMDLSQMQGGNIPPQAMAQMKSMGLDKMVSITQPGNHVIDMVYPDAQAYAEMTIPAPPAGATTNAGSVTLTSLGNETVGGHPCVKNKAVVTDAQGATHNFTVWNATDLKNFPMQIASADSGGSGNSFTMTFMNISLSKPDSSLFLPPSGFTKYDDMQQMMQAVVMKKMGGGFGGMMPGGAPPQ
jgi:hypothetical protein